MLGQYLLSHLVAVITAAASTLMVLRLFGTSRTPQSLVAWTLALMFVPLAAIPLYFLLGARKFPRTAKRTMRRAADPSEMPPPGPVARVLCEIGAPPARGGHRFELLRDGEKAYARLMALIAASKRTIDLTMFILGDDATGRSVVEALVARARDGVDVRVVLDAVGCTNSKRAAARALREAGGSVRAFMPLLHAPFRGRNNLRCHRKLALFDGEHLFAGGMNLAEEYMGPRPLPGRWRDVACVVSGPVAVDAAALFESDWEFCGGTPRGGALAAPAMPASAGEGTVQLVPSGPDMVHDTVYDAVLTAIAVARERIVLVTPYYVPDDIVQHALVLAARRGVRTELLVPSKSNHALADFARRGLLRELTASGVHVRFYAHGMVHAKGMVVDGTFAFVGSPNMDMRSFFLNYEDAVCLYSAPEIAEVRSWADALLAECTDRGPHSSRSYWMIEQLARMVAPEL